MRLLITALGACLIFTVSLNAEPAQTRTLSGAVVSQKDEVIPGTTVVARYPNGEQRTITNDIGVFRLDVPDEEVLRIYQSIVITATALEARAETHKDEVYKRTLFSRDDQLVAESALYIPDDGTFELKDPTRSYGYEGKASMQLTRYLSLNAGLTQVTNSFYRNTAPRIYVDSAPHRVANAAITFSRGRSLFGSLRYRHAGSYRLDGLDPSIRASGLDVVDLSVMKSVGRWIDVSLSVDNVTNKSYYETQNLFESRVAPGAAAVERIHGTPGYPTGFTAGVILHLFPTEE